MLNFGVYRTQSSGNQFCCNFFQVQLQYDWTSKAESHCSDNENDNDHDAKRTPFIG